MNTCKSCGSSIPEENIYCFICSMCMGDSYYGIDKEYIEELEKNLTERK